MSRVELHRPADRLPCRMTALHVLRVQARFPQHPGRLASDVETVHTEDDDRVALRQLAGPFLDTLGVAPRCAVDDVLSARDIVLRPGMDELDALPRLDHALH